LTRANPDTVPPVPHLNSNNATALSREEDMLSPAIEPRSPEPAGATHGPGLSEGERSTLRDELCEAMAAIHQRGWCDGTGGNFSCVLEREPQLLLMAPSGVDKGRVRPQELIVVDDEGQVRGGGGRASAETLLHLAIVRETGAGAVLHTHSQAGTLLSQWSWELRGPSTKAARAIRPDSEALDERRGTPEHHARADSRAPQIDSSGLEESEGEHAIAYLEVSNLEMLKGIAGITTHQSEVRIPVLANDQDLGRLSRRAVPHLDRAPAGLLIAGHGLYAWGQNLSEARRHLEILEFLMEQRWRQLLLEALMERGLSSTPANLGQGS